MAKQDYEVTRPWAGVTLGEIVKLDPEKIHPAIKSNIRPVVKGVKATGGAAEAEQIVKDAQAVAEKLLADTKTAADKILADAGDSAEQIVKDARAEADSIMLNAHAEAEKLKVKK